MKKLNNWLYVSAPFAFVILVVAVITSVDNISSFTATNPSLVINSQLGNPSRFSVLAYSGIQNKGVTTLLGDVATYAAKKEIGFNDVSDKVVLLQGINHQGDFEARQAQRDVNALSDILRSEAPVHTISSTLSDQTVYPGAYTSSDGRLVVDGTLTLDAQGDSDALFLFKATNTITAASSSRVVLINGARACNVFWYTESEAFLEPQAAFVGTLIASKNISLEENARIEGSVLSRKGHVFLNSNTITRAVCEDGAR